MKLPCRTVLLVAAIILAAAKRSYYEVLEVGKDAPDADIKKAYRRLALKWHPDRNKDPGATEQFREVAEAYEVLGDPERRRQYDSGGADFDFGFGFNFGDADDVFKAFFGDEDPFAGFDEMFSSMQREMDEHIAEMHKAEVSAAAEPGGLFSAFSSFVSSITSSFSSSNGGGDVKVTQRTTETKIGPDGHNDTKTVESDGAATKVTVEETSSMAAADAQANSVAAEASEAEPETAEDSAEGKAEAQAAPADEAAPSVLEDRVDGGSSGPEAASAGLSQSEREEESSPAPAAVEPTGEALPEAGAPAEEVPAQAEEVLASVGSTFATEVEETPDAVASGSAGESVPPVVEAIVEPAAIDIQEVAAPPPAETAAPPPDVPPAEPSQPPMMQALGGLPAQAAAGAALGRGPTPVGSYPSPFSAGAAAVGTARWMSASSGPPAASLGPGDSRGAPASTLGLSRAYLGMASAGAAGSPGVNQYGVGVVGGGGLPSGSSPFARADGPGIVGLDATLGGGVAAGGVSRCDSLAFVQDVEPTDTAVRHVPGSACCNSAPQPTATNRYGCCHRCLNNPNCEVYVWQPSSGTCWLLQWKGPLRTTMPAPDRVMGHRSGEAVQ